jgi:hypothetical protein
MMEWLPKIVIALIPLLLGGLATIAWQNSHALAALGVNIEAIRLDLERTKASLEPGRTIMLRLDKNDAELQHQRELLEQRLINCR